jgi:YD repeat-containing protein
VVRSLPLLTLASLFTLFVARPVDAAVITRTSAFEYSATTGLLTKEVVEPDAAGYCVQTTYDYTDGYGHKNTTTTANCGGASADALFTTRVTSVAPYTEQPGIVTVASGTGQAQAVTTYYTMLGQVSSVTDANGLISAYSYDVLGRNTGVSYSYAYCSGTAGGSAACPTIAGAVGAYVVVATPVSVTTSVAYGLKTITAIGGQIGPYTKTYYDGLNRPIRVETQSMGMLGATTLVYQDTEYNALGQVARRSRPYSSVAAANTVVWTSYSYDALGRLVLENRPDGGSTSTTYAYQNDGLKTAVTVTSRSTGSTSAFRATTQATVETRDAAGQVISILDAKGKTLTRTYDPVGNLTSTTDAAGNKVTMGYDPYGRNKTSMQDPDMGSWSYGHDALGQLIWQKSPKQAAANQSTRMTYDVLGRLKTRTEADLSSTWHYDAYADASACSTGKGKLCEVVSGNGYRRKHTYDTLGRLLNTATTANGKVFNSAVTYDSLGRVDVQTYPNGLQIKNNYNGQSFLYSVSNVNALNGLAAGKVLWTAYSLDAEGHLVQQIYGNGLSTSQTFDANTGALKTTSTGKATSCVYGYCYYDSTTQNLSYAYDLAGNLMSRVDLLTGVSATYDYDDLYRLKTETRSGGSVTTAQTITWAYDDIGNITSRSDVGTYAYPASGASSVRPHAVSSVAGTVNGVANPSYAYDANGNLTGGGGRTATWTSFDKPLSVTRGTNTLNWLYDAEYQRVVETHQVSGATQRTTVYLNPANGAGLYFEEENGTAGLKQKNYVSGSNGAVAVVLYNGTTWSVQYLHKDHLGSTSAVTNDTGALLEPR